MKPERETKTTTELSQPDDTGPSLAPTSITERVLAAAAILVVVKILHNLLVKGTVPLHDTRQAFEAFHALYTSLLRYHEFPMWFSEVRYGVTSPFQLLVGISAPKMLMAIYGIVTGHTNTLRLFYAALDLELFVFGFGAYLFGRSLYRTRMAAVFLTASCLFSTFYLWQIYFDFLLIAWLPLAFYLLRVFAVRGDARALIGAALSMVISLLGNVTYFAPLYLFLGAFFTLAMLHDADALRHPIVFLGKVLENIRLHRWSHVALGGALAAVVLCLLFVVAHTFDHIYIASDGRLPDGTLALNTFLFYGYDPAFSKLLELIFVAPANADARIFTGYVNLALALFALLAARRRSAPWFFVAAAIFVLLSLADATIVPELFYRLVPAANRLRHIGLLLPIVRLMVFCLAGIGLDTLIVDLESASSKARAQSFLLAGVTLFIVIGAATMTTLPHDGAIPYQRIWPDVFTRSTNLRWASFLACVIVIAALCRSRWAAPIRARRTAGLILLASCLELTNYQFSLYRTASVQGRPAFYNGTEVIAPRLTLWRELDALPDRLPLEQALATTSGMRYGMEDVLVGINRCAPDPRTDYHNLHVAELAAVTNAPPGSRDYSLTMGNIALNPTHPQLHRMLGCGNLVDAAKAGPYRSRAAEPAPVNFTFPGETAAQGIEIVFVPGHPEKAPKSFTVLGSEDSVSWKALFTAKPYEVPAGSAVSRSWWFGNNAAYRWYRVQFQAQPDGPAEMSAEAVLLKTDPPMIRLTSNIRLAASDDEALLRIAAMFRGAANSQTDAPDIIVAPETSMAGHDPNGGESSSVDSVSLVRQTYNSVELEAEAGEGGRWMVFSDGWHPEWHARVDGVAQPVRRANVAFKAVWLDAGSHHVTFEFGNRGLSWAYALLLATSVCCLVAGLVYLACGRNLL